MICTSRESRGLAAVATVLFALAAADAARAQSCASPGADLAGWWPADGFDDDIVGGSSGGLKNGATYGAGKVGQA